MTALWPRWYRPFDVRQRYMGANLARIQAAVCEHFDITLDALTSESKKRDVAWPRQLGYFACREITHRSYPRIAFAFGRRDTQTVWWGASKAESRIASDPVWAGHYAAIRGALGL